MNTVYYFAYGSNMNHEQMKKRCENAKFIERGYIENYDFVYDGYSSYRKGAVGNIIPCEGSIVFGALWEISEDDLKNLDRYEGYPYVYNRKLMIVKDDKGLEYNAWVYLREPQEIGMPSKEYHDIVIMGAKECNLPEDYINKKLKRYEY
jgi:gamma-glutamylcyclotransferase (GGCT)/AIG2-like uncharacterized protein YtfP